MRHEKCHYLDLVYLVFVVICCLSVSFYAQAATEISAQEDLSYFDEYVPYYLDEDTYAEESFMYFGKDFGFSLGTGVSIWTGALGKYFKPAYPILEMRLLWFTGYRSSIQYTGSLVTHHAEIPEWGLTKLRMIFISIDYKYYFESAYPSSGFELISSMPYITFGLSYINLTLSKHRQNTEESFGILEWKTPLFGKIPVPIWPSVGLGIDLTLKPRVSSLTFEAKWKIPLGTYEGDIPILDQLTSEKKIGDNFMFSTFINFVFDIPYHSYGDSP
ncbi:MAG: hypothetical protein M9962_00235 [Oligoflexia bacterium]|nr:hypothetical protein [Oligoflexia bacterium]